MHRFLAAIFTLVIGLSLVVAPTASAKDIVETAVSAGKFTTLAKALTEAGLIETLKGKGPFTVFAPTDEAFAKVPKSDLDKLLANKEMLKSVLLYHVVAGEVKAGDVVKLTSAKSVQGSEITIKVKGKDVTVAGAKVITTDIMASNGVIHVIDTVMMPPAEMKKEKKEKGY